MVDHMKRRYIYVTIIICCLFLTGFFSAISAKVDESANYTVSIHGIINSNPFLFPNNGVCYQSAFVSLGNSLLTSTDISTTIDYFANLTGKGLFVYNDQATLMLGEDLWMCMELSEGGNTLAPLIQSGLIHAIMVGFTPAMRNSTTGQVELSDNITVQQIANGTWDSYIIRLAGEAKAFGYPIFMRIGQEMNINQGVDDWAGVDTPSFADNNTAFIGAWQRIVNIFRNEGASNVYFVWNPNCDDIGPNHWTAYYPGNNYVDWVGIDLYQYQPDTNPSSLLGIYNDYSSQKPVMICEWGITSSYSDLSCATFVNNFFDAIEARPGIKMISYQYLPPDFSFNSTSLPLTTLAYVNRISNTRYISQPFNG